MAESLALDMGLKVNGVRTGAALTNKNPHVAFIQEHPERRSLLEREGLERSGVQELELLERDEALRSLPARERRRRGGELTGEERRRGEARSARSALLTGEERRSHETKGEGLPI